MEGKKINPGGGEPEAGWDENEAREAEEVESDVEEQRSSQLCVGRKTVLWSHFDQNASHQELGWRNKWNGIMFVKTTVLSFVDINAIIFIGSNQTNSNYFVKLTKWIEVDVLFCHHVKVTNKSKQILF